MSAFHFDLDITGGQHNLLKGKNVTQHNHITHNLQSSKDAELLERLVSEVATNAFHNSVGRLDAPKCHPGTREEVMGEIGRWIESNLVRRHWMLWLSGPAGAGKSAIAQSVADRCEARGIPVASFFFFRTDNSRNSLYSLVATLAYQILCLFPHTKQPILSSIDANPLIFSHSLEEQFRRLLISPLLSGDLPKQPLVIIIDGLDECDTEAKHKQQALIRVLDNLLILGETPFIVFIASRPEPHLTMSFNQLASPMVGLFLDEHYRPANDIRSFVTSEFDKIVTSHHLSAASQLSNWPSTDVVDDIVRKSSGQFIYAATVMRFISTSAISPVNSLEIVRGLRPATRNSPFAQIDAVYSYILSRVEDLDSVQDILAAEILRGNLLKDTTLFDILHPLGVALQDIPSCLAELVAIVSYKPAKQSVKFYHASLVDFLINASRSGQYHIDIGAYCARVVVELCKTSRKNNGLVNFALLIALINHIKIPTPTLTEELSHLPSTVLQEEDMPLHLAERLKSQALSCLRGIAQIYYRHHEASYMALLQLWLTSYFASSLPPISEEEFRESDVYHGFEVWASTTTPSPSHQNRFKRRLNLLTSGIHPSGHSRSPTNPTGGSSPLSYAASSPDRSHYSTPSSESPISGWPGQEQDSDKSPLPLQFHHPSDTTKDSRWLVAPTIRKQKSWWKRF